LRISVTPVKMDFPNPRFVSRSVIIVVHQSISWMILRTSFTAGSLSGVFAPSLKM